MGIQYQKGVGLVEVLVALLLLAVGVLGFTLLQVSALNSSIESIPGIGEKTMLALIQHFKSVKRLKLATEKEISDVVGVSKAKKISDFYKTNNS